MLTSRSNAVEKKKTSGYVGFASLPNQIHRDAIQNGFEFTVMAVGMSGLGKSTLLNSLFLTDLYQTVGSKQSTVSSPLPKTMDIDTTTVLLEEKGVKLKLGLVDTPGFGDFLDNTDQIEIIAEYVDEQYRKYMDAEAATHTEPIEDTRVHACLYFIAPTAHGLKAIDIEFMKKLQDKTNLIPVIAKADTFTRDELQLFKRQVRQNMQEYDIRTFQPAIDTSVSLDELFPMDMMPFAVIGSNTFVNVGKKQVRGRQYPWGVIDIENDDYSDFTKLRSLLIRNSMRDLYDRTHEFMYEKYRMQMFQSLGFSTSNGNLMEMFEKQRTAHETKLAKASEDMEASFSRKMAETEQKIRDQEQQYMRKLEQLASEVAQEKAMFETKTRELEALKEALAVKPKKK